MTNIKIDEIKTDANKGFKKMAVQWLNEKLCFVLNVVLADRFVFRNCQLLKPVQRYMQAVNDSVKQYLTSNMIKQLSLTLLVFLILITKTNAQFSYGDDWYNNPLGFEPLKLHTSMGFIVPAVAVGTCLLLTKKDTTLRQRFSIYNEIGLNWGYKYPHTFLPSNNTGINYQLRKFMSIGIEFNVLFLRDDFNKTTGFAIRPFARFYPINNQKWRLYFESGGGFIYTLTEFPKPTDQDNRLGLQLNGITTYGIGSDISINKSTSIMFGIRHLHISNGNTKGTERNPSHDSNGFYIGLTHKLN